MIVGKSLGLQAVFARAWVVLSTDLSSNLSRQAPESRVNLGKSCSLSEPRFIPLEDGDDGS